MGADEIGQLQQHLLARLRCRPRPCPFLEDPARRGDGGIDIGGIAMRDRAEDLPRRRVDVLEHLAGGGGPELAVDEGLARWLEPASDRAVSVDSRHVVHGGLPAPAAGARGPRIRGRIGRRPVEKLAEEAVNLTLAVRYPDSPRSAR